MMVAERLRQEIARASLLGKERITCSLGTASWHGQADTLAQLLKRVDDALYEAKRSGRDRVCHEKDSVVSWFRQK